ncbi:MAG: hypothetical protein OWT28_12370 [Firmicutes bacterium]|nr:hypothetical protein [Bacillota bacterium]
MKITYQPTSLTVSGSAKEVAWHLSSLCQEDGGQTPLKVALASRLADPHIQSFSVQDVRPSNPPAHA